MKSEVDLGKWLRSLSAGRASCVFARDVADTLSVLRDSAGSGTEPLRVISLTWPNVPALANELGLLVSALAKAVPDFAQELYGRQLTSRGSSKWTQSVVEVEAQSIVRELPGAQGTACRRILAAAARSEVPSFGKMAHAEQARQLALAIEPHRLLVLIGVLAEPFESQALRSLAQGAEWLGTNTNSRVALVLPETLAGRHELDHVTYEACLFSDSASDLAAAAPSPRAPSSIPKLGIAVPQLAVSPVEGCPHPKSDAEKLLSGEISKDRGLRSLFGYNRRVATRSGSIYVVDVLWDHGRLVIELDGANHRGPLQFSRDRSRDLELLLSGYRVVRFTEGSVLENTPWVLEQIRQLVTYCSKRESA